MLVLQLVVAGMGKVQSQGVQENVLQHFHNSFFSKCVVPLMFKKIFDQAGKSEAPFGSKCNTVNVVHIFYFSFFLAFFTLIPLWFDEFSFLSSIDHKIFHRISCMHAFSRESTVFFMGLFKTYERTKEIFADILSSFLFFTRTCAVHMQTHLRNQITTWVTCTSIIFCLAMIVIKNMYSAENLLVHKWRSTKKVESNSAQLGKQNLLKNFFWFLIILIFYIYLFTDFLFIYLNFRWKLLFNNHCETRF